MWARWVNRAVPPTDALPSLLNSPLHLSLTLPASCFEDRSGCPRLFAPPSASCAAGWPGWAGATHCTTARCYAGGRTGGGRNSGRQPTRTVAPSTRRYTVSGCTFRRRIPGCVLFIVFVYATVSTARMMFKLKKNWLVTILFQSSSSTQHISRAHLIKCYHNFFFLQNGSLQTIKHVTGFIL